jgi:hypothetical protein
MDLNLEAHQGLQTGNRFENEAVAQEDRSGSWKFYFLGMENLSSL